MSLLALQDLFRRYRDRATGVWKLGQDPSRTIFFDYGDTVFAQSTHLQDRLTTILVERGRITQAQMDHALANLKPGISIGKNLIEMGFITQRDLLDIAKYQVERIIHACMAQSDLLPVFESRELDAHVVRLPMNTAQLLLGATLAIQDREWLLELLGPLNQVVVLQGRSLQDLTLPADLAKLTPYLDGTRTVLELSREAQAEPMRVGAFALFLREMGWARLHEMPPLDRQALESALSPDPEPLSAPLPEPSGEPVPSLFATIEEAARPTTNLEHLSQSLDEAPAAVPPMVPSEDTGEPEADAAAEAELEPIYLPEGVQEPLAGLHVETGQAQMPTPAVELPPLPEETAEPRVLLTVPPEPAPEPPPPAPEAPRSRRLVGVLAGLLVVACLVGGGLWLRRRRRAHPPQPVPVKLPPALPAPPTRPPPGSGIAVPPPSPVVAEVKPEAKAEVKPEAKLEAKPEAKPEARPMAPKPIPASLPERLEAIKKGDLTKALAQGEQHVKDAPAEHWVMRLEIACQGDTIKRVTELFKEGKPDLFLLPMTLRDGRTCYQVLYGNFPSKDAAEREGKHLPAAFMAERNHPKVFRFPEIPREQ